MKIRSIFYLLSVTLMASCLSACTRQTGQFILLTPSETNIDFVNRITENDSVNIFDLANVYNGAGIGVGDFNNDGLQDLYFAGNMVPNKLYLNKGNMQFRDVTAASQTDGGGAWCRGVAVADINNDGKQDIYVCASSKKNPEERKNILYINQGTGRDGVCTFKNMAAGYGLADTTQSTMAYFFDYDNDGDLDLFIGVNHIVSNEYANTFKKRNINGEHPSTCKLYRNDWNDSLGHAFFTDVSKPAGILIEGYTHAVDIADFNLDGWQDMLVTNDYASSNVLYINNRDGSFTDSTLQYFKHTAFNSMGSDAVDINNDGWTDVVETDMLPQDNFRKKMFQPPSSYQTYLNTELYGYQYQYPRNMLQLNMGSSIGQQDSVQHPVFGDIGFYAGIAETDWSWCPLVADFDHDGNKDIVITNGFPKDITDRDYISYRRGAMKLASKKDMLEQIPRVKIHNYAYRNNGNGRFTDISYDWGLSVPSFSNAAAYADLDNDGDQDMIISNIDDPASIYENRIDEDRAVPNHYLSVKITGSPNNLNAIGASIQFCQKKGHQYFNNMPYRGYLSTQSLVINAGMGTDEMIDSVIINWPGNKRLVYTNVKTDQLLTAEYSKASSHQPAAPARLAAAAWFTNITTASGVQYVHQQRDFIDFNIQKLLPHKLSEYAPAIAAGDINGDGLDDFITGGSPNYSASLFVQLKNGGFVQRALLTAAQTAAKKTDDRGVLLFDADNDQDLDLYIAAGGYSYAAFDSAYIDHFYTNDGKGDFTEQTDALPFNTSSKLCVRAADYDRDGDLDLFVSGRVEPRAYPKPVSSFIYRNDSKQGKILFSDVTKSAAPALVNIGLGCDALFTDYDNDGWPDLVLAGEWMPLVFLHNDRGIFRINNQSVALASNTGWWNGLAAGDFDNDGDIDYVAGNLGLNSFYRATAERPVGIRAKDFDDNGSYDAIPSLFLPATLMKNTPWLEFPAYGRDDMIKQVLGTRVKYQNYQQYAAATIDSLLPPSKMKDAVKLAASYFSSAYFQNDGAGHFTPKELPWQTQLAPLNGMVSGDFDADGNLDLAISTNDYGTEPLMGRYDAMNGIVLKGDGKGGFIALTALQSGLCINGNGRGLCKLSDAAGAYLLAATQNSGALQIYKNRQTVRLLKALPDDVAAEMVFSNGKKQKVECYYGSSFLSQGARFFELPASVVSCSITNAKGVSRMAALQ